MKDYTNLLRKELIPALGCTEPIDIALVSSKCKEYVEGEIKNIEVKCSGNICYNIDKVKEIFKLAGYKKEVTNDLIKTKVSDTEGNSEHFSGGEKQKIAIARALYKKSSFVILDEPTAALDPISESEIYENLNTLIENKTTIFISHRMSSCRFCEDIIVMKDGEIVQRGSHNDLLNDKGLYFTMWNEQAKYYNK